MEMNEFFRLASGEIQGPIRVGRIRPNVERALGAHTGVVWLSQYNVEKQFMRHGNLNIGYYERLPDILKHGEAFRIDEVRVALILDLRGIDNYRF